IFKDTRLLAEQAVIATEAYVNGGEPEANDTETYDNGIKVVPSYLLESVIVVTDNVEPARAETGYWTRDEIEARQAGGPARRSPVGRLARPTGERRQVSTRRTMADTILEMRGITKKFPGVTALEDVNLTVTRGEIHAICGENGAGKSTLM